MGLCSQNPEAPQPCAIERCRAGEHDRHPREALRACGPCVHGSAAGRPGLVHEVPKICKRSNKGGDFLGSTPMGLPESPEPGGGTQVHQRHAAQHDPAAGCLGHLVQGEQLPQDLGLHESRRLFLLSFCRSAGRLELLRNCQVLNVLCAFSHLFFCFSFGFRPRNVDSAERCARLAM